MGDMAGQRENFGCGQGVKAIFGRSKLLIAVTALDTIPIIIRECQIPLVKLKWYTQLNAQ